MTEQVKAVKIDEKPKEVKTEVVDEVMAQKKILINTFFCCWSICKPAIAALLFYQGPPRFTKSVLKKGDKTNFPKKGDTVSCWYTGTLEDGTVFDTNIPAGTSLQNRIFYNSNKGDFKMFAPS